MLPFLFPSSCGWEQFVGRSTDALINGYLGELCETIATHQTDTSAKLRDLCFQVNDKVPCTEAVIGSYVSTESLLVNKGGRQVASSLPAMGKVTEYKVGDTLVSNIRPYFKKIWFADQEGTCSGDVIVFRALEAQNAPYVYSILRTSSFFDWVMLGSKGTKMPRGDKKQMMNYPVSLSCKETDLELLSSAAKWISSNERQNGRLSELRDVLLPKLMSGEIDVSKVEVPTQPNSHLSSFNIRSCSKRNPLPSRRREVSLTARWAATGGLGRGHYSRCCCSLRSDAKVLRWESWTESILHC